MRRAGWAWQLPASATVRVVTLDGALYALDAGANGARVVRIALE